MAADIPRFAKLGVIASMQPSHAIGDLFFAPKRLGPERVGGAYAWKTLLDSGAVVVAGSDAPVEVGDPRIEFYAAVARRSLDGFADADWHLEQRVSREQALKMLDARARLRGVPGTERGSIEVGKQADFTVFASDLMTIPEKDILKARRRLHDHRRRGRVLGTLNRLCRCSAKKYSEKISSCRFLKPAFRAAGSVQCNGSWPSGD